METRSSEAKSADDSDVAASQATPAKPALSVPRHAPWWSFALNGIAGLVFGGLATYLVFLDAGNSQGASVLLSRPLGLAALVLIAASLAAVILRNRLAIGIAAYTAIALAAYIAAGGLFLALSPVDHTAWPRLGLSLVMLLWSFRLIIATRFLRA